MSVRQRIKEPLFAERLKQERLRLALTQQELTKLCAFGSNQISRYETGDREPTINGLFKLSDVLGVSADYLIGLTNDPHEHLTAIDLDPHERELLDIYRNEGWPGILRLGAEKMTK